jgi:hypothetical protein
MIPQTLEYLKILIALSFLSALMGFGFQRMMDFGMIFEWYKRWLERMPYRPNPAYCYDVNADKYIKSKFLYYVSKPLGICIICNTTWIGIINTIIASIIIFSKFNWIIVASCIIVGVSSAAIVVLIVNLYNKLQRSKSI